jgi:hypothetical protein
MLETQLGVLLANQLNALGDQAVLLLVGHLALLHQELVVVDLSKQV